MANYPIVYTKNPRLDMTAVSGFLTSDISRIELVNYNLFDSWVFYGCAVVKSYYTGGVSGPDSIENTVFYGPSGEFLGPTTTYYTSSVSTTSVSNSGYNSSAGMYFPVTATPTPGLEPDQIVMEVTSPRSLSAVDVFWGGVGLKSLGVQAREKSVNQTRGIWFINLVTTQPFEDFDPDIFRVWLAEPIEVPWPCPKVSPNEWVTSDTINNVFIKLDENMQYLKKASMAYATFPQWRHTRYWGWFGTNSSAVAPTWNVYINGLSANWTNFSGTSAYSFLQNVKDIKVYQEKYWIAHDYWLTCRDKDYNGTIMTWLTAKPDLDTFGQLGALDIDADGNMYVLDVKYNEVIVYNIDVNNIPTYLRRWGGSDTLLPKARFVQTNDVHIDIDGNVFIVDTGNSCVKKFTPTGGWMLTLTHPEMTGYSVRVGKPISVTTDQDRNIHVLTFRYVFVFDYFGNFVKKWPCATGEQPVKILTNFGKNGFLYIVYSDPQRNGGGRVIKFTTNGVIAGSIAEFLRLFYPRPFNSACQDNEYNLYIAADRTIFAYVDDVTKYGLADAALLPDGAPSLEWPLSSILIDHEEFVQDWVYNRGFSRLWDNMEIFRRSIWGKFLEQSVWLIPGISSVFINFMDINDELYFPWTKEDLIIGTNEFVTFDVVNRVVGKMCDNQEVLRQMMLDAPKPRVDVGGTGGHGVAAPEAPIVPPDPNASDADSPPVTSSAFSGPLDPKITPSSPILEQSVADGTVDAADVNITIPGAASFENVRKTVFLPFFTPPPVDKWCWSWNACRSTGVNGIVWTDTESPSGSRPTNWVDALSKCCTNITVT